MKHLALVTILMTITVLQSIPLFAQDVKRPEVLPEYKPVDWPEYSGSKVTVAVLDFEDGISDERLFTQVYNANGEFNGVNRPYVYGVNIATWPLGEGLADMLVTTLMATNRFTVLDREISLQAFDLFSAATAKKLMAGGNPAPRVAGVKYFVTGSITAVNDGEASASGSIKIAGIKLKGGVQVGSITLQLRLIDATNGRIVSSQEIEGTVAQTKASVGIEGFSASVGNPFGQAKLKTVDKAADSIITTLFTDVPSVFYVPPPEPELEPEPDFVSEDG